MENHFSSGLQRRRAVKCASPACHSQEMSLSRAASTGDHPSRTSDGTLTITDIYFFIYLLSSYIIRGAVSAFIEQDNAHQIKPLVDTGPLTSAESAGQAALAAFDSIFQQEV